MHTIQGRKIIKLMRGCLSEVSGLLKQLRRQQTERPEEDERRHGLLFSLDMNLAVIHLLGIKLMEAEERGEIGLSASECVVIGISGSYMTESVARLIDDALEGFPVTDERVDRELGEIPLLSESRH